MADEVTRDGQHHIKAWLASIERYEQTDRERDRARHDKDNCAKALAKWMLPEDAKPGEKICVWYGDSLIQVESPDGGVPSPGQRDPIITIRKRGRALSR